MEWDLSVLYSGFDDPKIERDFAALGEILKEGERAAAADEGDRALIDAFITATEALEKGLERLGSFASLTLATDATNETATRMMDRIMQMSVGMRMMQSAFVRRIGRIERLDELIEENDSLKTYAYPLRRARDEARHLLPEASEQWMLRMQLTGGDAFSTLRDKLDATLLVDYRGKQIPLSEARNLAYEQDADVRRDAYEAELEAYKKVEIPMAAALSAIKGEANIMAEARGYESVLDMILQETAMDRQTLDALMTAIDESLPMFRRFLRLKGRLLGHENGLPFYDLFAPLSRGTFTPRTYTLDSARETLVRELSKFSPAMGAFVCEAYDHRWIDAYPRAGKSGGAFCASLHTLNQSRVLTNFTGSFGDVSTLAHELGHAWHNRQMDGLTPILQDAPMPLAETASIFNETLLSNSVMASVSDDERFSILESALTDATQVIVDIDSRYRFETAVVDVCKTRTMSADELKATMLKAQDETYGDGLDPQKRHPYMWACKSHYYSTGIHFYNFPYAFGLLFGKGVYALYEREGAAFAPTYNALLRACGSAPVAQVAASVGIDVRSPEFWRGSLKVIERDIDEFERLCEKE